MERLEAHPQSPTAKWLKVRKDVEEAAIRGATARQRTDRERTDATEYHRASESPTTGA